MAVYDLPKGFEAPVLNFSKIDSYKDEIKVHEDKVREWCLNRAKDVTPVQEYIGDVIQFPVADGYALYMIAATKPIQLIHLPYYDGYSYQYAHRLTKKDIVEKAKNQRALNELFSKKDK